MWRDKASKQVLEIYEKEIPGDKRPRLAIEAASTVLKIDNKKNRAAARAAAWAAARKKMQLKILDFGISLLEEGENGEQTTL